MLHNLIKRIFKFEQMNYRKNDRAKEMDLTIKNKVPFSNSELELLDKGLIRMYL